MSRVWAIVRLTMAEAIRTRLAISFTLILAGLMVLLIATASGDGTVTGKVQMFLSYSIGITHFLLSLLVVFLTCRMIDEDITSQRIDSLMTKPLARWQFLMGRWLGIVVLVTALMLVSMGLTYGIVRYYHGQAEGEDKIKLEQQVLIARKTVIPPIEDVEDEVNRQYERLKADGKLEEIKRLAPSDIRKLLRNQLINYKRTVPPRSGRTWTISGLPTGDDVSITLRYKLDPSMTTKSHEGHQLHSNTVFGEWIIGDRQTKNHYSVTGQRPYRTVQEIRVPGKYKTIKPDGTLDVSFINRDPRDVSVTFPIKDGIEILIDEGTFAPNFVRTVLMLFATLIFLATLGVACSTWLSFPVASLVTVSVFFVGLGGNFLWEAVGMYGLDPGDVSYLEMLGQMLGKEDWWGRINGIITLTSLQLIPVLSMGDYTDKLIDGRTVDWLLVTWQFIKLVFILSVILAGAGIYVFRRRELGRVTV